jgi:hypothetical protein
MFAFDNKERVPQYSPPAWGTMGIFTLNIPTGTQNTVVNDFLGQSTTSPYPYDFQALTTNTLCTYANSCAFQQLGIAHAHDGTTDGWASNDYVIAFDSTGWVSKYGFGGSTEGGATILGGDGWGHLERRTG